MWSDVPARHLGFCDQTHSDIEVRSVQSCNTTWSDMNLSQHKTLKAREEAVRVSQQENRERVAKEVKTRDPDAHWSVIGQNSAHLHWWFSLAGHGEDREVLLSVERWFSVPFSHAPTFSVFNYFYSQCELPPSALRDVIVWPPVIEERISVLFTSLCGLHLPWKSRVPARAQLEFSQRVWISKLGFTSGTLSMQNCVGWFWVNDWSTHLECSFVWRLISFLQKDTFSNEQI